MEYVIVDLEKPDSWHNHHILSKLTRAEVYKVDTLNIKGKPMAIVYYNPSDENKCL